MYALNFFVLTRVMDHVVFVMCDTLSGCILLTKFFDNYVRGLGCYKTYLRVRD